jgi:hypothetical protein
LFSRQFFSRWELDDAVAHVVLSFRFSPTGIVGSGDVVKNQDRTKT